MSNNITKDDIQAIVHQELNLKLNTLITRTGWGVLLAVIATVGAWYSLYYQVQNLEEKMIAIDLSTQRQIDNLREDYLREIREIKTDIRIIRDNVSR